MGSADLQTLPEQLNLCVAREPPRLPLRRELSDGIKDLSSTTEGEITRACCLHQGIDEHRVKKQSFAFTVGYIYCFRTYLLYLSFRHGVFILYMPCHLPPQREARALPRRAQNCKSAHRGLRPVTPVRDSTLHLPHFRPLTTKKIACFQQTIFCIRRTTTGSASGKKALASSIERSESRITIQKIRMHSIKTANARLRAAGHLMQVKNHSVHL